MTNPVHSVTERISMMNGGQESIMAPSPILFPANSPWVKSLSQLFPEVPLDVLQGYAKQFQDNCLAMVNAQIQRSLQQSRETARQLKENLSS
ncbi:hypothetical protein [Rhabdochlamydiaceae symbiont of Dictyostelium giganteum]|uniref:hypothetical protein n=1 Tax=Rhabdochlamydiaceae symbiont of Dictyostelium giganteum TaxID=3342349 RepID=UPI0038513132